ncbi:hypothetical protein DFS33DRAFT_1484278 [Desarmillaria ectypa]|nr:hypothetical protein DFS33DRAFT_1484278 [Desarmillaria ectypa]
MMNRMTGPKEKPMEKVKNRKGERTVKEPMTGLDVTIKNADFKYFLHPDGHIGIAEAPVGGSVLPTQTAPNAARPGNMTLQPYLPAPTVSLSLHLAMFDYLQLGLTAAFTLIWFFFGFPKNDQPIPNILGRGGSTLEQAEGDIVKGLDADQSGDYVNYEVAFAYQTLPGRGSKLHSKSIHLVVEFFVGIYDWLYIPAPIWIQVEGIVGTVRLRIQFISEAPFVRNIIFTFRGVLAVEVSTIPTAKDLPNVLDLPLVLHFVTMAIAAGTAEFVAPKTNDLIGCVQILVKELMKFHNKDDPRRFDTLAGFEDADQMDGILHCSIVYFDKVPLKKEHEQPPKNPRPPPPKTAPVLR